MYNSNDLMSVPVTNIFGFNRFSAVTEGLIGPEPLAELSSLFFLVTIFEFMTFFLIFFSGSENRNSFEG